ncbi:MAG: hypothetical protein DRO15_02450 [Thermoprotei archaeon]|nr:MAG: hypothetical protein DRO15_02450 [Thermoprotei archaeon]
MNFPNEGFTTSLISVRDEDSDIEIILLSRDENPEIANGILRVVESLKVAHWREISTIIKKHYTVSFERLFKIMQDLIRSGDIIELPCRFFTTPNYLMKIISSNSPKELAEFIKMIQRKTRDLDLTRCSPSLVSPVNFVKIKIEKGSSDKRALVQILK